MSILVIIGAFAAGAYIESKFGTAIQTRVASLETSVSALLKKL